MYSLFKVNFSPIFLVIVVIIIKMTNPGLSTLSMCAIIISLHQFLLLFNSIGAIIPIRYLFGTFMCIQVLIGPVLAFNGLDKYQYFLYRMQVSETDYFAYALPAVIAFIIGLHARAGEFKGEKLDLEKVKEFATENPKLPTMFIALGFVSSLISSLVSSEWGFIFYLLGSFKFIGAFLLIIGDTKIRFLPLLFVFGSIVSSSLHDAMFHDLLIWIIFTGVIFALKIVPTITTKIFVTIGFIMLAVVIQQLKGAYRFARFSGRDGGVETFYSVLDQQSDKGIFSLEGLAPSAVRINQGFIVSYVMKTVPNSVPFSEGEEMRQVAEAAFLPRVLAPNKLVAGDRDLFNKYTGLNVQKGTSMGLGALSDGYLNFGLWGGCAFMLLLGLIYSEVLVIFHRYSAGFPIAILFTALVFYHPIRPDNELQTVLGHLVKSCVLLAGIYYYTRKTAKADDVDSAMVLNSK